MTKKEMENLTDEQILQGIEDIATERLGWTSATVVLDRGIVGMIIGHKKFVEMMESAASGGSKVPKNQLN